MDERAAKWRLLGPGLVVAATGVGAGDLVATLIAGARYGDALLWAAIAGAVVKLAMAEGVGRFTLATGRTLYDGWRGLPGGFGGYKMVEWIIGWLVAIMFVTVVGLAVLVAPDIGQTLRGLVPLVPEGAGVYALGLIGGVGGTVTVAAYGYWIAAKGWTGPEWMEVMRLDNRVAYAATGVFVVAMLIVGAELLHAAGIALERGDRGLLDLGEVLSERFGPAVATVFLIGFLATAFSSVLGVWQGVSLMFADFYAHLLGRAGDPAVTGDRSLAARAYMLWLTFPPMLLLMLDRPFGLIVAYGVLGAVFMPFLAGTLLWLLNSEATPKPWRNGWVSNGLLATAALMFLVLAGIEVAGLFS